MALFLMAQRTASQWGGLLLVGCDHPNGSSLDASSCEAELLVYQRIDLSCCSKIQAVERGNAQSVPQLTSLLDPPQKQGGEEEKTLQAVFDPGHCKKEEARTTRTAALSTKYSRHTRAWLNTPHRV